MQEMRKEGGSINLRELRLTNDLDGSVVVAVVDVGVVQPTLEEVVLVVAVRHQLVAAVVPMPAGTVDRSALLRVLPADLYRVLVVVTVMLGVQVTVVYEVHVLLVPNLRVPAPLVVLVLVLTVSLVCHSLYHPLIRCRSIIRSLVI